MGQSSVTNDEKREARIRNLTLEFVRCQTTCSPLDTCATNQN